MKRHLAFLLLVLASPLITVGGPVAAQDLQLDSVVLLTRHGVRSPTETIEELDKYAATPWPRWPVGPGELTPRGAGLLRLMGRFYHAIHAAAGLLPPRDCPAPGDVAAWADVSERTRLSAQSILDGLYPGCGLKERHQADLSRADPLFHPLRVRSACPFDAREAKAAVLARIGGTFASLLANYAKPLAEVQAILCPASIAAGKAGCGLGGESVSLESRRNGGIVMKGPIARAATDIEIFQLESAEGLPPQQVAWGRLEDDAALRDLAALRVLQFDLMERTPYLARRLGSNLLAAIVATIEDRRRFPGVAAAEDGPRFAVLAGHDTNLANIAGLLGLGWSIPGFQPNDPTPGGALAFETLRDVASGHRYVRLRYYAQTLDQMRRAEPLDLNHPAGVGEIDLPACRAQASDHLCPLERFAAIARAAIDETCVMAGK